MWGDKKDMLLTRSVFLYFFSPRHSGSKKSFAPLGGLPNQPSGSASRTGSHVGRSKALRCTLSHFTRTWPVFVRVRLRVCVFPPVWKLVEHLKVGKTWMDDATEPKVTIDWNQKKTKQNSCFMSRQKKATLKRKKNKMTRVGMSFYEGGGRGGGGWLEVTTKFLLERIYGCTFTHTKRNTNWNLPSYSWYLEQRHRFTIENRWKLIRFLWFNKKKGGKKGNFTSMFMLWEKLQTHLKCSIERTASC